MPGPADPFLGVACSATGRVWLSTTADDRMAIALGQRTGVPDLVARVMAARGVGLDQADDFLAPTLRRFLPDPSRLKDMDAAAERLASAIIHGQQIAVFGDYDVDGATSAALMVRFIEAAGGRTRIYVPDRLAEGYGPSIAALLRLQAEGAAVVVTVDCGATAYAPLAAAAEAGLDVVVIDHHRGEARLPPAVAVVNPNRLDEDGALGHLAAVGVAFLAIVATNRRLRAAGWYAESSGRTVPDPMRWLDLVALGTVCDMVPLTDLNRALVAQGLKVMGQRGNAGLNALTEIVRLKERADAWHLGFMFGPRINAGGRVGQADLGARLLVTDDDAEATALAKRLDTHNGERQEIEAVVLLAAMEQVEGRPGGDAPLLFASGEGWHPGVIGIVAGRLKERYNRPACVIAIEGGLAKGSARSVPGLDLGQAVLAARQAGLLEAGGGHAMAAGFTVRADRLAEFQAFMNASLIAAASDALPTLGLDGALDAAAATAGLVETLRRLGPFGSGNPEPRFAVADVRVVRAEVVGMGHVRCTLVGATGARLKGIAFRCADSDLGQALLTGAGRAMHIAGTLRPDTWQGNTGTQLIIDDAAFAGV